MKAFLSNRILKGDPDLNQIEAGAILVDEDIIVDVVDSLPKNFDGVVLDFGDLLLAPGLVDTHVHINEPGRTDWEGFLTATRSAAAGGITTVMDMPLNCLPVTTTKEALEIKVNEVEGKLFTNVGFWGGVIPETIEQLPELLDAGVFGVKSFLIDSGIDEFPLMTKVDLEKAMPIMARYNSPYLIHAEVDDHSAGEVSITDEYQSFLDSRPRSFENKAINMMIELSEETQCPTHIVHLSSSDMVGPIREAKSNGVPISVETCPHYLVFESEKIPNGKTLYKCCPPIREKENKDKLWDGVKDGVIDFIVSDHSPCTPSLKLLSEGDFDKAWGGIASLQLGLSLIWTEMKGRGFSLGDLFNLMSTRTAKFIGLENKLGKLAKGYQADFIAFDPDLTQEINKDMIYHKHKETPYEGREVHGEVKQTILGGKVVFKNGEIVGSPQGKILYKK